MPIIFNGTNGADDEGSGAFAILYGGDGNDSLGSSQVGPPILVGLTGVEAGRDPAPDVLEGGRGDDVLFLFDVFDDPRARADIYGGDGNDLGIGSSGKDLL